MSNFEPVRPSMHNVHGMVIQDVENGADVTDTELPNVAKLHKRTAHQ